MGMQSWISPLIDLAQFWVKMMGLLKREDLDWVWVVPTNRLIIVVEFKGKQEGRLEASCLSCHGLLLSGLRAC